MNKIKLNDSIKTIFLIIIFTIFFLSLKKTANADEACSPYDCSGTGTYLKILDCKWSGIGLNCINDGTEPFASYTCPVGGGAGTCSGLAEGVDGCLNQTAIPGGSSSCTTCSGDTSYNYQCATKNEGDSCGNYGTCTNCTVTNPTCPDPPKSSNRGCCLIGSTPTPTPAEWCGDGICQASNNENCSSCETDCGTCSPPAGPYCGDNICNNGENTCSCATDCPGTCNNTPTCSVSLSPSVIDLYTDDSPFPVTANISSIQNGNVSQVEFTKSNSNINLNPVFDADGSPWESQITPVAAGTTTLTANVYMGDNNVRCSATATVNISVNISPTDYPPNCESFDVVSPTITSGDTAQYIAEITDEGLNIITDSSFETGTVAYWPTVSNLNEWYTVDSLIYPSNGIEGRYYAKISRANPSDAYAATNWIDTGENLTNQQYTFKFLAKSHEAPKTISNLLIQRYPFGGDWTGTSLVAPATTLDNTVWKEFKYNLTFPNPGNGSNTSQLRAVLRPNAVGDGFPLYYDAVKLYKTSSAGINPSTVLFFYIPTSADPCVSTNWTLIGTGSRIGSTDFYEIYWDTTGVPAGDYTIAVNAADIQGNNSSGNPGNCSAPGYTLRPSCNSTQTITACTPSCGGGACGDLSETPSAPTNLNVNGQTSGNLDLTSSSNLTFSWTLATITPPANINKYEVRIWNRDIADGLTPPVTCNSSTKCVSYIVNAGIILGPTMSTTQLANYIHSNKVYTAVRAINDSCVTTKYSPWSTTRSFDLVAQVSGTFYESSDTGVGNNCLWNGTDPQIDITNASPTMSSGTGGNLTTFPGSNYIMSNVPYAPNSSWTPDYAFNLTLNLTNPDPTESFYCNCPSAGSQFSCFQTDTTSPASNQDFFVTKIDLSNSPWWQASEGNTYAASGYLSPISNSCDLSPSCDANLIVQNSDNDSKSAGVPISGGTINVNGYYTAYDGITQPHAENTTHNNVAKEDYNYFAREIDLSNVVTIDNTITEIPSSGTIYDDAEIFFVNGDLTMNISTLQTVSGNTKKIIFVNRNVIINNSGASNRHLITVENGSYFAIIAQGNITIENSVGNTCSNPSCTTTNTNIDGVYIASGNIIIDDDKNSATADNMFAGEGTFVGWSGVSLNRSFNNTTNPLDSILNNTYPTNVFRFRPDLTENTPKILKKPSLIWQEVN